MISKTILVTVAAGLSSMSSHAFDRIPYQIKDLYYCSDYIVDAEYILGSVKLDETEPSGNLATSSFIIHEVWKGDEIYMLEIKHSTRQSGCRDVWEPGFRRILYVTKRQDGNLFTSSCVLTSPRLKGAQLKDRLDHLKLSGVALSETSRMAEVLCRTRRGYYTNGPPFPEDEFPPLKVLDQD